MLLRADSDPGGANFYILVPSLGLPKTTARVGSSSSIAEKKLSDVHGVRSLIVYSSSHGIRIDFEGSLLHLESCSCPRCPTRPRAQPRVGPTSVPIRFQIFGCVHNQKPSVQNRARLSPTARFARETQSESLARGAITRFALEGQG